MRKLCLLAAILATTACMRRGVEEDGALSNAQVRSAGDALGNTVESSAGTFGPMAPPAQGADSDCVVASGDTTDADGDNIPASGTLTYACTATAIGLTGTLDGTITLTDDTPNAAAWSFTGTADLEASLTGGGGASIVTTRAGQLVATQASVLGPFSLTHDVGVTTVFTSGGDAGPAQSATVTEEGNWTLTFTPTVAWEAGQLIVRGSLEATGDWNVTVGAAAANATLSTPTPLTLDPACETRVTAGSLAATFPEEGGGEGSITVTWTGCGQRVVN